jgi:ribonuclease T1
MPSANTDLALNVRIDGKFEFRRSKGRKLTRASSTGSGLLVPLLHALLLLAAVLAGLGLAEARRNGVQDLPVVRVEELPREAHETLALIKQGGPFPYRRDGVVFGNREKRLPPQRSGYYREYTVPTPGARDRGARRIIAGGPGEYYYTDDHYNTFRRIRE